MDNWDLEAVEPIAIIGMAGRFPGASSVDAFWDNLQQGMESITHFSLEELQTAGIDPALLQNPQYVRANGVLADCDRFDANFFGFNAREAELMDPQHRLFLECAWEALEVAGYDAETFDGRIGVFAGVGLNSYWLSNLTTDQDWQLATDFQLLIGNDKDFVPTRVSYKLNLTGPSLNINTACSSSLVAVQVACQSLLNYQCDAALAGGVSLRFPQQAGYLHQEGLILSPDGHCRAFDAQAQGTVGGNGVGIVVLKRLSEAIAAGDPIQAVIRGSAINNDGSVKVGYTAPSVSGQAAVIREAQMMAGVHPETITYIEAHGTGTVLGDPIEIAALTQAFRTETAKTGFCAIGSVKTNIGHLDTAAGVAGLIKAVLALQHRQLPPSLHYEQPNPAIDFAQSPFYVNAQLREWQSIGPRRAGVSSFGIGGTNAHVILEEAPAIAPSGPSRSHQVLVLSAKTEAAQAQATCQLATYLQTTQTPLADVAYTLQVGRKAFPYRRMVLCQNREEAIAALTTLDPQRVFSQVQESRPRPVTFMFSGQGSQYAGMAAGLYQQEVVFRTHLDHCATLLHPHLGLDLRQILYSQTGTDSAAQLQQTALTQPALFALEYALAQLWMSWGIRPQSMIGHSIGEYVAACLAGVFSLEAALELVAIRGKLMQQMPAGTMLAVPLSPERVQEFLSEEVALAAVNHPELCVLSGPRSAIETIAQLLQDQGVEGRPLHTSHAFHSPMMAPLLPEFLERVRQIPLAPPKLPFISNLTGTWITAADATDPEYWGQHLRQTVQFAAGLQEVLQEPDQILLEVGPGRTLTTLALRHPAKAASHTILPSLPHPQDPQPDPACLLTTLGKLWLAGLSIDWTAFYAEEQRHRLPLPTYPFQRQRYWIDKKTDKKLAPTQPAVPARPEVENWSYVPSWRRTVTPPAHLLQGGDRWLVFLDPGGLGAQVVQRLHQANQAVVTVQPGTAFARLGATAYCINPAQPADYLALLQTMGTLPTMILHGWNLTPPNLSRMERLDQAQILGFGSLILLAQALGQFSLEQPIELAVLSNQIQVVTGSEVAQPEQALVLGPVRVIPQEYPALHCRSIDIMLPATTAETQRLVEQLLSEMAIPASNPILAYRGPYRWEQTFTAAPLPAPTRPAPCLRQGGVYLITGGLGGIGLAIARYLAESVRATLLLVGRSALPEREQWATWLATHGVQDPTSDRIRQIQELEALGSTVLVLAADITDAAQLQQVLAQVQQRCGPVQGVIHSAGLPATGAIQQTTLAQMASVLAVKVKATCALETLFQEQPLDFFILCSSLTAIFGGFGQVDYCAANAFLDAFAQAAFHRGDRFTLSINWDTWQEVGMAVKAVLPEPLQAWQQAHLRQGMSPREGVEAFRRLLHSNQPQALISPRPLFATDATHTLRSAPLLERSAPTSDQHHQRPELQTAYAPPTNPLEQQLVGLWQEFLGLESVGIHDNFFDLGGHSLLAAQVNSRLRDTFQVNLPQSTLFDLPTIARLAAHLQQFQTLQQPATPASPHREEIEL